MIQFRIDKKPLSVNQAWQGVRYKTKEYQAYEKELLLILPKKKIDKTKMLRVEMFFGFSTSASDLDNPVKLLLDICQKKFGFDDKSIFELNVRKCLVKKGNEFFEIGIYEMLPF
jgi:Holliday junction resolvase RusA-like endonuclease